MIMLNLPVLYKHKEESMLTLLEKKNHNNIQAWVTNYNEII